MFFKIVFLYSTYLQNSVNEVSVGILTNSASISTTHEKQVNGLTKMQAHTRIMQSTLSRHSIMFMNIWIVHWGKPAALNEV